MNVPADHDKRIQLISALIIFLGISVFYFYFTAGDRSLGFLADDAVYLLMADIYSPWKELNPALQNFLLKESQFPPLYPVILSLFGAHTGNPALAQTITTAILLSLLVTYFFWLLNQTGNYGVSLTLTILFGFLPGTLILSQEIWSEFLFILLVFSVFLVIDRGKGEKKWLYAAVLVTFATLTRTVGIAMLPAFYSMLYREKPKLRYWAVFLSTVPFVVWLMYKKSVSADGGYTGVFFRLVTETSFGELFDFVLLQFVYTWQALLWTIGSWANTMVPVSLIKPILLIIVLLAIAGLVLRVRLRRPDAIFFIFYTAIILLWPFTGVYFMSRFIYVLWPFLIYYAYCAVNHLHIHKSRRYMGYLVPILVVLLIAPGGLKLILRGLETAPVGIESYTHNRKWLSMESRTDALSHAIFERNLAKSLDIVSKYVGEEECIFSVHPQIVMLHSKRISYLLPEGNTSKAEFERAIRQCRYILALRVNGAKYPPLYPLDRITEKGRYEFIYLNDNSISGKPLAVLARRRGV